MIQVYGDILDEETRCQHYHSERDIIAHKCFACQKYYPCFLCHDCPTKIMLFWPILSVGQKIK